MTVNYRRGAVTPPTDPTLLRKLDELVRQFPSAAGHREALSSLGSQIVYATELNAPDVLPFGGVWIALVRFSEPIENTLGLTREVLLLYSPHSDLQYRAFQAISKILDGDFLPREVTSGVALVCSPDPNQERKLDDWSRTHLTAVPLPYSTTETDVLAREILKGLERRLFLATCSQRRVPLLGTDSSGDELCSKSC